MPDPSNEGRKRPVEHRIMTTFCRRSIVSMCVLALTGIPLAPSVQGASAQPASANYSITSIGVIKGDVGSTAFAINEHGAVVGMSFNSDAGTNQAVHFADGKLRAVNDD